MNPKNNTYEEFCGWVEDKKWFLLTRRERLSGGLESKVVSWHEDYLTPNGSVVTVSLNNDGDIQYAINSIYHEPD